MNTKFQLGHGLSAMETGGHFSAFTAIEKKSIFTHSVNLLQFFQKVDDQKMIFR